MGLVSTLLLAVAIATTRIILLREGMDIFSGTFGGLILGIGAALLWLYNRGGDRAAPAPDGSPTTIDAPRPVEKWFDEARRAANIVPGLTTETVLAVIWKESSGDPGAVGSAGEQGLMQVTEIAAQDVGEAQPTTSDSPQRQITVGAKYLGKCLDYVGGDTFNALRCYNEGPPPLTREASKQYAEDVLKKREALSK